MIGEVAIDSLKLKIPKHLVKVLNPNLESKWVLVNEATGDIDETYFKENSLTINRGEYSLRFGIEVQTTSDRRKQTYLIMLLPAKVLKDRYFEGITKDNIHLIYDELVGCGVAEFSFDTFLYESGCLDVDFKKDVVCTDFDRAKKLMYQAAKPSKQKDVGCRVFDKIDNDGIEFSTRKTTKYLSNPYLKFYHKGVHISNDKQMKLFADTHLSGDLPEMQTLSNLVRVETTIKNKKHFASLGIENNTLATLLDLTTEQKESIIKNATNRHMEKRLSAEKIVTDALKPTDIIVINSLAALMNLGGVTYERVRDIMTDGIAEKTQRSKKKSYITNLYKNHLEGLPFDEKVKALDGFFNDVGWV